MKSFLNNTDKVVPLPMWRLLYGAPDPTLADVQVEESLVTPVNKARENLQAYLMEEEPTSATTFNEILNKRAKELQTVVGVALRLYVGTSVFFFIFFPFRFATRYSHAVLYECVFLVVVVSKAVRHIHNTKQ